jgi:hypothetical protein
MSSEDPAPRNTPVNKILKNLLNLPKETITKMPILTDIAALSTGPANNRDGSAAAGKGFPQSPRDTARDQNGPLQKRLDRRYARVCVVHSELNKLNFRNVKPGTGFDDFIFQQTDFDIYKQISAEDFELFYVEGLEDYNESFYKKNFMMGREKLKTLISKSYHKDGDSYFCKTLNGEINPLLLGIVRTLHTSLDFVPLIGREELRTECAALIGFLQSCSTIDEGTAANLSAGFPAMFDDLLRALDGVAVTHLDTMVTTLSVKTENGKVSLYGTFRPQNKAFTLALAD